MASPKGFVAAVWLAVAAVVVIAGGVYVYMHPELTGKADGDAMTEENGPASDVSGSLTVQELIAKGQNLSCTFAFNGGGSADTSGTVYVAGGKVRGDYETKAAGQTYVSHVIVRDNAANIWVDGMAQGFTSSLSGAVTTGGGNAAPDINSKLDYDCTPWMPDESKFTLPASVTFKSTASIPTPS